MKQKLRNLAIRYLLWYHKQYESSQQPVDRLTYRFFGYPCLVNGCEVEWSNCKNYDTLHSAIAKLARYEDKEQGIESIFA